MCFCARPGFHGQTRFVSGLNVSEIEVFPFCRECQTSMTEDVSCDCGNRICVNCMDSSGFCEGCGKVHAICEDCKTNEWTTCEDCLAAFCPDCASAALLNCDICNLNICADCPCNFAGVCMHCSVVVCHRCIPEMSLCGLCDGIMCNLCDRDTQRSAPERCTGCRRDFCGLCINIQGAMDSCDGCEDRFCIECLTSCGDCGELKCRECADADWQNCRGCDARFCADCLSGCQCGACSHEGFCYKCTGHNVRADLIGCMAKELESLTCIGEHVGQLKNAFFLISESLSKVDDIQDLFLSSGEALRNILAPLSVLLSHAQLGDHVRSIFSKWASITGATSIISVDLATIRTSRRVRLPSPAVASEA